nr:hypothetical protein [Tanacetum cinerariifolium]
MEDLGMMEKIDKRTGRQHLEEDGRWRRWKMEKMEGREMMKLSSPHFSFFYFCDLYDGEMIRLSSGIKSQAGSKSRPPMLNKENYVPWSSRLLWYAKSRPNGKLIHNSILNGPYVRRMIPEPGDANREVIMTETFHVQTDDELSDKELKHIEVDDQAIQTILLDLPEDIYAAVDSCETAQEIWLRVQQMMKGYDIRIQEKKAKLFNEWEMFTSNEGESIESYYHRFLKLMNDLKRNKHFSEKIATDYTQLYDFLKYNQKEVDELKAERLAKTQDPLALMANSNNPYARVSSNPRNRQIAQPGMNMGQDRQMQMVGGNGRNQFRQYARNLVGYNDVIRNQVIQNVVQNTRFQNIGNQNGLIGVQGNANQNQIGNGNLVAARAEGNAAGQNGNQIRCYNCRGVDIDEIEEVNANGILMANPQQASTSGTQTDNAPVYDSDGSPEVKSTIVTLQRVFKHIMTIEIHNWSSSAHQELHKIVRDENFPIVNQVDARLQNFEIQFLKEAAKFIRDFKSLAKEADASLAKHKILEMDIERLLKVVVSHDIISVVQNASVIDTSDLQTELERMKELFENCIIKKETEYAKLLNDWYKKCNECKYDKISYDKAYKAMEQKIERLQAQLVDLKGKSKYTSCVSNTLNPLSQKLENENVELEFQEAAKFIRDFKSLANEADASLSKHKALELEIERLLKAVVSQDIMIIVQNESVVDTSDLQTEVEDTRNPLSQKLENKNVELEFQVLNYARENAHLKATYKNLFDSILCRVLKPKR